MFCRFGLVEESRPVAVAVWLNTVCTRPFASTSVGSTSMYVFLSFETSRYSSTFAATGKLFASPCSTSAPVA